MDHGHFLNMGGFMRVSTDMHTLKEPEKPGREASGIMKAAYMSRRKDYEKRRDRCDLGILRVADFKKLIQDRTYEFPMITAAEIRDRSKGDALAKFIAILQTSWFIFQCITRGQQRLALTEFELVTLALASLNAITYVFWWHKPLGVQEPVRIYLKSEAKAESQSRSEEQDGTLEISAYDVITKVGEALKELVANMFRFLRNPCQDDFGSALIILFFIVPTALFMLCAL